MSTSCGGSGGPPRGARNDLSIGPNHVAALLGPYLDLELIPTGGVTLADAAAYLEKGAIAVAVGGAVTGEGDPKGVESAAASLVEATNSIHAR